MLGHIKIRERGATPRRLMKVMTAAKREAWKEVGTLFHSKFRAKRFTVQHAIRAGYQPRAGDKIPFGTKAFWKSYVGRKLKQQKHRLPLVWSGETRNRARMANIVNTSQGVKVKYGLNALNRIPWAAAEFRKVLPEEAAEMAQLFDEVIDKRLKEASGGYSETL